MTDREAEGWRAPAAHRALHAGMGLELATILPVKASIGAGLSWVETLRRSRGMFNKPINGQGDAPSNRPALLARMKLTPLASKLASGLRKQRT